MTPEMKAMAEACTVRDAARAKVLAAQLALVDAQRELDNADAQKLRALDALERSCRAALPTLTDPESP